MDKDSERPVTGNLLSASENTKTSINGSAVSVLDLSNTPWRHLGSEFLNFGSRPSYVIPTALPPCRVQEMRSVHN